MADEALSEARRVRQHLNQAEKQIVEKGADLEFLKIKNSELNHQIEELKRQCEHLSVKASDFNHAERLKDYEQVMYERKRLEEKISVLSAKLEAYSSSPSNSLATKEIQDELNIYKKLMKCNSCHTREKSVVLLKCMHVFCKECIDIRLETRQRKCPNCTESFSANDVKPIYL